MGKFSRDKGRRYELEIRKAAEDAGLEARVTSPNQTQDGDTEFSDVRIGKNMYKVECKMRQSIGDYLWDWIQNSYAVALRKNRKESLVLLRLDHFLELIKNAE